MPLTPPATRNLIHTRRIQCDGYEREDGLWDIEARMTDVKSYEFPNTWRETIKAGEPLHEMLLRITLDDQMEIKEVVAVTDHSPFEICPNVAIQYQALVGLKIGPGWRRSVKQKVGGINGCTHMTELLGPVATTAFQTIYPLLQQRKGGNDFHPSANDHTKPAMLNSCYTWGEGSEMIKQHYPDYYSKENTDS